MSKCDNLVHYRSQCPESNHQPTEAQLLQIRDWVRLFESGKASDLSFLQAAFIVQDRQVKDLPSHCIVIECDSSASIFNSKELLSDLL